MRTSDPFADVKVEPRKIGLFIVCLILLVIVYSALFPTAVAVVAMVLTLPLVIFLHELGHFTMAKRADMKVTEFFVGFGPRVWSFRRGETEYGLKAIPLGGYCKVIGMTNIEEVDPDDEPRAYRSKSWGAKVLMDAAGPFVHFIIAIVLMFVVLFAAGDYRAQYVSTTLAATQGGAAAAQLQKGDTVLAINGTAVTDWDSVHDLISPANRPAVAGETVTIRVKRNGEVFDRTVTLTQMEQKDHTKFVGAGLTPSVKVPPRGFVAAAVEAPKETFDFGWDSVKALGSIFSPSGLSNYVHLLAGDKVSKADEGKRFLSPVGFAQTAYYAVKAGWVNALELLIAINVFIGILNLLPLLPFDGGHIAIATYESIASRIRGRRVQADVTKLIPVAAVVFAVLGFILVSSVFLDFARGVPNPF